MTATLDVAPAAHAAHTRENWCFRGLDPLPLRAHDGTLQITWIEFKGNEPNRLVIAYD